MRIPQINVIYTPISRIIELRMKWIKAGAAGGWSLRWGLFPTSNPILELTSGGALMLGAPPVPHQWRRVCSALDQSDTSCDMILKVSTFIYRIQLEIRQSMNKTGCQPVVRYYSVPSIHQCDEIYNIKG